MPEKVTERKRMEELDKDGIEASTPEEKTPKYHLA